MKKNKFAIHSQFFRSPFLIVLFLLLTILNSVIAQERDFFKKLHTEKNLKLGLINEELFPFCFFKEDCWQGSDIDLADELAHALHATIKITTFANHSQLLQALNTGQVDLAIGHLKQDLTEGLEIRYSAPYLNLNYAILTNRLKLAQSHIPDLDKDLLRDKALTIGSLDSPRYQELINRFFPKATIVTSASRGELLNGLLAGKYDAAFGDEAELSDYFRNQSGLGLHLQYWQLAELQDELVIYLPWKNQNFLDWINIFLEPKARHFTFSNLCQAQK